MSITLLNRFNQFSIHYSTDQTDPTIGCPGDEFSQVQVVSYSTPTTSDNFGTPLTVSCDRQSGSSFPFGETTVTCTALDEAGNTAGCSFQVTVGKKYKICHCLVLFKFESPYWKY